MRNFFLNELASDVALRNRDRDKWLSTMDMPQNTETNRDTLKRNIRKLKNLGISCLLNDSIFFTKTRLKNCKFCMDCDSGITIAITNRCNKDCFFCYNRGACGETGPIDYEELFKQAGSNSCKSLAITGGDPLLSYKRLVSCLKKLKRFNLSTHLYTNGVLLNEERLRELRNAGVDELRFNLAASDYQIIRSIGLAQRFFTEIAVESPAIPGHAAKLRKLLTKLDAMQIPYVNLHELLVTPALVETYKKRGFLLKGDSSIPFYERSEYPIQGSEETAFQILEFSKKRLKTTSVHYCSYRAKALHQHTQARIAAAEKIKLPYEEITNDGFLKKIIIYEPDTLTARQDLKANRATKNSYTLTKDVMGRKVLMVSVNNRHMLRPQAYDMGILYTHPIHVHDIGFLRIVDMRSAEDAI